MCTKNLYHIFMLSYFTSLLFQSFDAVIIFSRFCSGHVTICTNYVNLHIFNWDLLFPYLQEVTKTSVSKGFLVFY